MHYYLLLKLRRPIRMPKKKMIFLDQTWVAFWRDHLFSSHDKYFCISTAVFNERQNCDFKGLWIRLLNVFMLFSGRISLTCCQTLLNLKVCRLKFGHDESRSSFSDPFVKYKSCFNLTRAVKAILTKPGRP